MAVYGLTRASTRKQQASREVQAEMIRNPNPTPVQYRHNPETPVFPEKTDTRIFPTRCRHAVGTAGLVTFSVTC